MMSGGGGNIICKERLYLGIYSVRSLVCTFSHLRIDSLFDVYTIQG